MKIRKFLRHSERNLDNNLPLYNKTEKGWTKVRRATLVYLVTIQELSADYKYL